MTDTPRLWLLTIWLQGRPTPIGLQFKSEQAARSAYSVVMKPMLAASMGGDQFSSLPSMAAREEITDDFGRTFAYVPSLFGDALLQDLTRAMVGDQEIQLMSARSQQALQSRVEAGANSLIRPAPFRQ